jgi:hypothetical protein
MDAWLAMPREQAVEQLTKDPRFGNFALDFNIYFLGFKNDRLRKNGAYTSSAYEFPSAIHSAREVLRNGDYFKLLDLEAPAYMAPATVFDRKPDEKEIPNPELFRRRATGLQTELQAIIDFARNDPAATVPAVCDRFSRHYDNGFSLIQTGVPFSITFIGALSDPNWYFKALGPCFGGVPTTLSALAADLEAIHAINAKLFALLSPLFEPAYKPASVSDFLAVDVQAAGFAQPWISWSFTQRNVLSNSSTNSNRKRGAYALKRFFCDDLTPIGVENPKEHGGGAHGSDPACAACHYKLDPIAGYFRHYGNLFHNYSGMPFILFDDLALAPLADYENAWRAPPGSAREWNVGYVRSVTDESRNDYGSELGDLHSLLRRAPEVKACLVRRLFEYALGEGQAMEPGFLSQVTMSFESRAKENSSEAFRWLAGQVALSNSFAKQDPEQEECYDFPAGSDPSRSPPCRVSFLLERNCKSCHSSTEASGKLDLTSWAAGPDGVPTFPHTGDDGKPLPLRQTLEQIVARLSSSDPEERMPYLRYMSAQDRAALFLWAQETLAGLGKKGGSL